MTIILSWNILIFREVNTYSNKYSLCSQGIVLFLPSTTVYKLHPDILHLIITLRNRVMILSLTYVWSFAASSVFFLYEHPYVSPSHWPEMFPGLCTGSGSSHDHHSVIFQTGFLQESTSKQDLQGLLSQWVALLLCTNRVPTGNCFLWL